MTEDRSDLAREPLVRAFGLMLRGHREAGGLSRPQLADALGCSAQWIEKLETGRKPPSEATADDLDTYFKTATMFHGMWEEIREAAKHAKMPTWFKRWVDVEKQAHTLKNWEPLVFPGLLQTRDYATGVVSRQPDMTADQIEAQVNSRLERQEILTGDDPTVLFAIIDEGVLHRPIGTAAVMCEQLAHLVAMSAQNNITIQVVPLEAGASCGLAGAFVVANLDGEPDNVYLESEREGRVSNHPVEAVAMSNRYAAISADALPKRPSIDLITKVMEERWTAS